MFPWGRAGVFVGSDSNNNSEKKKIIKITTLGCSYNNSNNITELTAVI
jgi:hypothetical protein